MCDCYGHKCETCDNLISMHIADWCTIRENVHVFCPACVRSGKVQVASINSEKKEGKDCRTFKIEQVFTDVVIDKHQVVTSDGIPCCSSGQLVIIMCEDPAAYGIHLN